MTKDEFDEIAEDGKCMIDLANIISFDEFNKVIYKTNNLLDFLGDSACRSPIINIVSDRTYILNGEFLFATSNTLKSIDACCRIGCFADANMLIRKYRDDLFLYLYIIETSNNFKGLTEEEFNKIVAGEMTEEKLIKIVMLTFTVMSSGIRKDKEDKAVDAWFNNAIRSKKYKNCIDICNYIEYLKRNKLIKDCIEKYNLKEKWKDLGRRQNNYTHNNGRRFLTDNIISYNESKKSEILLNQVYEDIATITSYFLIVLILIKPEYISSFDYVDFLDVGMQPPSGSQYWVASIVQDYLDEFVIKIDSDIKEYLRDNNPYGMKIV